jgi:hypothetical protein
MSRFDNMQDDSLDGCSLGGKWRGMTRTPMLIMLAAAAALAGCNQESHTIVAGGPEPDDNASNAVSNGPVTLPPSISASKVYRCADNSVLYVNWMSDGSANVRNKPDAVGTSIAAGSPDIKGDAKASSITFKGKTCKA